MIISKRHLKLTVKRLPFIPVLYHRWKTMLWFISKPFLPFLPIKVNGVRIYVNPNDNALSRRCFQTGQFEPLELKEMKPLVPRGSIFIDIGANIGVYTRVMASQVGDFGRVIAFEPAIDNLRFLRKNVEKLKNVTIEEFAVGESDKDGSLFLCNDNKGDHRIFQPPSEPPRDSQPVRIISLAGYLSKKALPLENISVIKIDVQGLEPFILRSLKGTLKQLTKTTFFVEYWPIGLIEQKIDLDWYLQFLNNNFAIQYLNRGLGSFAKIDTVESLKRLYDELFEDRICTTLMLSPKAGSLLEEETA